MANDDTILREVDQALADDKQANELQKNLPGLLIGAALVVAAVGGWEFYKSQRNAAAEKASVEYEALASAGGSAAQTEAIEKLADGKTGYAVLAKLRLAASELQKGEGEKALGLYREVYSGSAPKRVKNMARLRAGLISLDQSREAVIKDVGTLEEDKTPLGYYAREILGLAAIKAGDYQGAEDMFLRAASSPDAPEAVQARAHEFAALAAEAKSGVAIPEFKASDKSEAERYFDQLQKGGEDLGSVLGDSSPVEEDAGAADSAAAPKPADTPDTKTQKSE